MENIGKTESPYKTLAIIAITISLMSVLLGYYFKSSSASLGSVTSRNLFSGGVTNSSTTLGTADAYATTVASMNVSRQFMVICNDNKSAASSSDVVAYLHFADTSVATGEGISLESGECYEINQNNLYVGPIWAAATDTAYLTWMEK